MVNNGIQKYSNLSCTLWKMDFRGAFTLMSFHPTYVSSVAVLLSDDLVCLFPQCNFGLTGTPFAFQVITRVLQELCHEQIHGMNTNKCAWYVDDCMGISPTINVTEDILTVTRICEKLLGPNSVAPDKTEVSRNIVFIGWNLDMAIPE
jgi:hypothetical protein